MSLKRIISVGATLLILTVAIVLVRTLWLHYMDSPWTRDGRVRADVINIAPDVAGLVADVLVRDNQNVKAGDLLLRIDPAHYQVAVKQAEALVAARKAALDMRKVNADRRADMDDLVVSRESREDAGHLAASALAEYQEAVAALDAAKLNLARTEVRAPVAGHITNLNVYKGDYAERGEASMALVDDSSFYVNGYFEETRLPHIKVGDRAELRLMSGERISGHVDSIARGIYDRDNPESRELIADVNPTFNWVRLAQRVPVRIHLDTVPEGVLLAAGMTCTVVIGEEGREPETSGLLNRLLFAQ
ncbi:efflux RND transporter periplasmic adaptor subunit [Pseudomonas resinovorans]|uniref:Efflux RND transporter periplasmic adaptor subunit n=1 Tax=Metapseudomonas resinovorans TaxID=53412 RepID=A0ABT4Y5E2_METRE|nr:efflux RND transporter periplasmic adaptor subunit [Pseudomonas resinovorans]MDA8484081.1 efflux RND transporter periplasmic adaptor subunit [Pseudomonas resinovorans]